MSDVTFRLFPNALAKLLNKEWDWDTDAVKMSLHNSTLSLSEANVSAFDYFNDATNELTTGGGYTAGGATIGSRSMSVVAADSWATAWAAATAYKLGAIVRPTTGNGFVYRVSVAGTSHATTEPTWPTTIGLTVTDNGVTWTCVGRNVVRLLGGAASWTAPFSAGPFRHAVMYADTAGASTADPLIGFITYGADQTGGDGAFDITPNGGSWYDIPIA